MTDETENPSEGSSNHTVEGVADEEKKGPPSIPETIKLVITDPAGFYKVMPKSGGFGPPLVFMVLISAVAGLIQIPMGLGEWSPAILSSAGLIFIITISIIMAILGFVGAAILFVTWRLMGSKESYETAYRCLAYSFAILPIAMFVFLIPYFGEILGNAWGIYLMIIASVEVHAISTKRAWTVFGTLFVIFFIGSVMEYLPATDSLKDGIKAYEAGDYKKALKIYKPLAEQGDALAQHNLGVLYENGHGVPQDYAEAVKWYRKAAEQGFSLAQNNLGDMYENGHGVPQNYAKAVKWYRKAAEQGNTLGQNNLGVMYEKGNGVGQDNIEAHKWYTLAAFQPGEFQKEARESRGTIEKKMTPAQIAEAKKLAIEWKPKPNKSQ